MAISIKGINTGVIRQKNEFVALALKIKEPRNKESLFFLSPLGLRDLLIALESRLYMKHQLSEDARLQYEKERDKASKKMHENIPLIQEDEYCQKVRPMVLEKIRRMPNSTITMEKFKRAWYEGNDGSSEHYNWTRYYALNLHAVFSKGTLEWRCFESTLHAGKVRSNITLALAISAQAINQSCTHAKKTEIGDNPAFTFRTFLLRLGLIGDEYKNVRKHLLANLDGDKAWRYDKSTYACLQNPRRTDDAR